MEERIKQLIEEFKESIVVLREARKTALDEGNEFEITKLSMSIHSFEGFIEDLEESLKL